MLPWWMFALLGLFAIIYWLAATYMGKVVFMERWMAANPKHTRERFGQYLHRANVAWHFEESRRKRQIETVLEERKRRMTTPEYRDGDL